MAPQRLPAGPKRSALGPLLARGDKYDGYISDLSRGSDDSGGMARPPSAAGFLDEREAKRQLRKEKNRASAAASRARREAYTASLEEEVSRCLCPRLKLHRVRNLRVKMAGGSPRTKVESGICRLLG
jgi:hypothetical protein